MLLDVTLAANIGIDGFMMNFWYGPSGYDAWRWTTQMQPMFAAADDYNEKNSSGFSIAPNIDASVVNILGGGVVSAQTFAESVYSLMSHASFMQYQGNYVIGVFAPEQLPPSWFQAFLNQLSQAHGVNNVYLIGVFVDPAQAQKFVQNGVSIFQAVSLWDVPPYTQDDSSAIGVLMSGNSMVTSGTTMAFANNIGQSYDVPSVPWTVESGGFQTEMAMWQRAIDANAVTNQSNWAHIITWNDHSEGTNLRPNTASQYAYYDIAAYYIAWYKTGVQPTIIRDVLYYSHRMHLSNSNLTATYDATRQTSGATLSKNGVLFQDQVYLTGFLQNGGTMTIVSGGASYSQSFPGPGVYTISAPLMPNDQPQFKLTNGSTPISFTSAFNTRPNPATRPPYSDVLWQDMLYRAGGSSRPPVAGVQNDLPEDRCGGPSAC